MKILTAEGFYRVLFDGRPGVGVCQIKSVGKGTNDELTYEMWTVMHVVKFNQWDEIATSRVDSDSPTYPRLEVIERLDGLPTEFNSL